jgi:hypothetical protein
MTQHKMQANTAVVFGDPCGIAITQRFDADGVNVPLTDVSVPRKELATLEGVVHGA